MTLAWVNPLGWTLVHLLWQGTLIAIVYAITRPYPRRPKSPQARYLLACAAMAAIPAWRETAIPALVALWFAGAAILSLRLLAGWTMSARLKSVLTRPAPREWFSFWITPREFQENNRQEAQS